MRKLVYIKRHLLLYVLFEFKTRKKPKFYNKLISNRKNGRKNTERKNN